mmetsp:Transcript_12626/g.34894  ORF Transcript_12626/g.34894 Transcript_12626/m.34894 type:complete len:590 (+) Transcript_12626:139-1908(+)
MQGQGMMGPPSMLGPPGTALRPPTGIQGLPGTAALRMGTAANRPGSRGGLGPLNTNIQVAERPVTQQGMMGMKVGAQGPGRQIADKSYFMQELRKKCDEMTTEISKMSSESDQLNKDTQLYSQMERKYETLIKEVRKLQGDLADYNLIVDKLRTNTEPQDIAIAHHHLKQRNDEERRKVDNIFTQRQEKEAETQKLEQQVAAKMALAEEKLKSLSVDDRRRYAELQDQMTRFQGEVVQQQQLYDNECRKLAKCEQDLQLEPHKQRYQALEEQRRQLEERRRALEAEANKPALSEAEQREQLLAQVKEDNKQLQVTERGIAEVDGRIKQAQQELDAMESGRGADSQEDVVKYQKLQEKDQEMTAFIESFPATVQAEQAAVRETEDKILAALGHLSKEIQRQTKLPSKENFQELQDEVKYKQRSLDNSQSTLERLQQEQEMRDVELQKINNLDQKISVELESLAARTEEYKEALVTYSNLVQLRQTAEETRVRMTARKQRLDGRRKALKQQVQALTAAYDKEKQALTGSESAGTLEALEQKLRHYEQNIFHLREYIESKEAETDYTGVYEEVSTQVAGINQLLQQAQQRIF